MLPTNTCQHPPQVTIHYMTPMLGTATRRSKIRKNWFFDCSCPRCSDPTELGTFASALLCPVCVKGGCEGILLPKEPLNPACLWTCSLPGCSSQTESSTVRDMVANFEKDLETAGESVDDLETLLVTLGQTLHPQHYLMMTGKRRLLASLHISSSQRGPPPSPLLQHDHHHHLDHHHHHDHPQVHRPHASCSNRLSIWPTRA